LGADFEVDLDVDFKVDFDADFEVDLDGDSRLIWILISRLIGFGFGW